MDTFVVVDLSSQGQAVRDHTRGWPDDAILAWLGRWGTVRAGPFAHPDFPELYAFVSPAHRATVFSLHGNELNVFIPNRQTFR